MSLKAIVGYGCAAFFTYAYLTSGDKTSHTPLTPPPAATSHSTEVTYRCSDLANALSRRNQDQVKYYLTLVAVTLQHLDTDFVKAGGKSLLSSMDDDHYTQMVYNMYHVCADHPEQTVDGSVQISYAVMQAGNFLKSSP